MLNEGKYRGVVKEWGFRKAKTGTVGFAVTFLLYQYEDAGEMHDMQPIRRTVTTWLSPNSMGIARGRLKTLGFDGDDLARLDPTHPEAHDFSGAEAIIEVTHGEWEGKPREEYEIVRPNAFDRVSLEELEGFDGLARAYVAAASKNQASNKKAPAKAPTKAKKPPRRETVNVDPGDADIPF